MSVASVGGQSSIQSLLLNDLKKNGLTSDVASQVESEISSVFQSQKSSGSSTNPTDMRSAIEAKLKEDVSSGSLTQEQADTVIKALDEFESQIKQSGSAGGDQGGQGGPDASKLFSKLDSNNDGKLTEDEFVSGRPDNVSEDQAKQLYQKIAEKSGGDASSGLTQDQFSSGFSAAAPSGGPPAGGGAPPAGGGGGGGGSADSSSSGSSDTVVSVTTTTSADGTKTTTTKYGDGSTSTSTTYGQAKTSSAESLQSILKALTKDNADSSETASYLNKLLSGNLIDTVA
ncbi:hypothetical protein CCC_03689 [Paramagnetospirillum magnetotacticum MS-1]|uniref:EF-hand domain-containing protein n=1 Tax=Paramagnetospirillum magnetotacticum MS-1 TaxID=272627 RepID=A0A0C2UZZ6_PARME|nr:suppressor protein SRP40 [Paramagnetospirillum magnetotacticum]KIL98406.1 hypothetical protein CCC_03689 [Paramagnetospirillum magnetotacticum MS-1]